MPRRERAQRRRAQRDGLRVDARNAYEDLARREAGRADSLAAALAAAAGLRTARDAVHTAEEVLALAVRSLREAGMTTGDIAATVQLDGATIRRLEGMEPTRPDHADPSVGQRRPVAPQGSADVTAAAGRPEGQGYCPGPIGK